MRSITPTERRKVEVFSSSRSCSRSVVFVPFSASFASLTKTATSSEHSRSSPNYWPPYSLSHTYSLCLRVCVSLSLSFTLSLLLTSAAAADKRVDQRKRKKRWILIHSVHMRQTTRHNQNGFHCVIRVLDGKLLPFRSSCMNYFFAPLVVSRDVWLVSVCRHVGGKTNVLITRRDDTYTDQSSDWREKNIAEIVVNRTPTTEKAAIDNRTNGCAVTDVF